LKITMLVDEAYILSETSGEGMAPTVDLSIGALILTKREVKSRLQPW
jgi:hypothetical protein